MIKVCEICDSEFKAKRSLDKYCSQPCRDIRKAQQKRAWQERNYVHRTQIQRLTSGQNFILKDGRLERADVAGKDKWDGDYSKVKIISCVPYSYVL